MTWRLCSKPTAVALLGIVSIAVAPQVRAESALISPQEAEQLVRAQLEEQKAGATPAEEEKAAEAVTPGKTAKGPRKHATKEAALPAPSLASAKVATEAPVSAAEAAKGAAGEGRVEQTASLPVVPSPRSRSERADAVRSGALRPLIARYASEHGLPYELADAVVRLESRYNPGARRGPNVGLTQINVRTAQSLGYRGDAAGLLDAETNLRYGLMYLAQAYRLAGGDTCGTILRYQFGHRTQTMTRASRVYCAKVKTITAKAD
ncbi:lytic transglycosylase domain-containing protein [Microvirga thermotolerans]|uniref:Transglycosylase SLT domain-containing protein n=1 Tax=Microvirga thermotolerans TaxID=2651334 RepID=A0A5P9JZH9_9HYPH|nr:lytic transglycosylase domain-containing protein [Microvirga thermotolerans]QFU17138.1 transglycosylase SLT domain-containing protein [Microvirga thermotolerans]